jgi:hypothetical protein
MSTRTPTKANVERLINKKKTLSIEWLISSRNVRAAVVLPSDYAEQRQRQQARRGAARPALLDHQDLGTSKVEQASYVRHTSLHQSDFQHGAHGVDHGVHTHRLAMGHIVVMKELASVVAVGSLVSRGRSGAAVVLVLRAGAERRLE